MKKISEMTLEELQDYALELDEQIKAHEENERKFDEKITELTGLNQTLQRRNNDLLMKVEQQPGADPTPQPEPVKIESCEDFARRIIKGE